MNLTARIVRRDLDDETLTYFTLEPRVALDIETSGLDRDHDRIGTVQLFAPTVGCIVVQVGEETPRNLCRLLSDEAVQKVFHHAMFDVSFMIVKWGVTPRSIACTKVASKLLMPAADNRRHTLQSLLLERLGITISKEQRLTNWLATELTPEQIQYACGDVAYLIPLLESLTDELGRRGLSSDLDACFKFLPEQAKLRAGGWPDVFGY